MKKLVQINVVCNGSTGRIMCDIAKEATKKDYETYCFYGRGNPNKDVNCIKIGNKLSVYFHVFLTRVFNKHGHGSYFATKKLVKHLKEIDPDIIHMHNIHGYYINLKVLFNYLKHEYKGKIIWSLHDCWTFTGHCAYFTMVECNKWQNECYKCPQVTTYPKALGLDTSKKEFQMKKKLFTGLNNLTIVTPSKWLADLVKKSFLMDYEVKVINNGIDLDIFKPVFDESIYLKYKIPNNKKIILGVANVWEERKGLNIFLKLSNLISDNEIIVLVGLTDEQIIKMPDNIIGIKRTENTKDLVKIYTIADVFLNPSLEETFSLVTIEAMACGTPVVTNDKSAIKELIVNKTGHVVADHDSNLYYQGCSKIFNEFKDEDKKNLLTHSMKYINEMMLDNFSNLYKG